jgi:hypothetical protein
MKLTVHKSAPLIVALVAGTITLIVALVLDLPFQSLAVQLGLLGVCMYPIAVGLEWLATR